jgi:HK97 family phage portal protein
LARLWDSVRSHTIGPLSLRDPALAKYFGGGPVASGVSVSEDTALNYAAVWQAVTLIAGDVGSLPLVFYKRLKDGGKERDTTHKLYYLLHDAPNPEMSAMVFRETLQAHLLTWGNAYAEIERDGYGRVAGLWPLVPSQVQPIRERGQLLYRVTVESREILLPARDVLHVPGIGFDGLVGYSPIQKARESLGLLAASEKFGASFFGNGSTFGGLLKHPGKLGEKAEKNLRESLAAKHQGADKAHRFVILEEGMDYAKLGVDPDSAQFLETRQFQIAEVARWFNLPLHKLREMEHSSVRANIEQEALDYVTSTLRPWLSRWEQELRRKLISPLERNIQHIEFVIEGLLRGDIESRYNAYAVGRNWGWLSANDVRLIENLNPIPGGDTYLSPMNMVPADRLQDVIDAQIAPKPAPAQIPAKTDSGEDDADRQALRAALAQQQETILRYQAEVEGLRTANDALTAAEAEGEAKRAALELVLAAANEARGLAETAFAALSPEVAQLRAERDVERAAREVESSRASRLAVEVTEASIAAKTLAADFDATKTRAEQAEATVQQLADDFQSLAVRCEAAEASLTEARADRETWQAERVTLLEAREQAQKDVLAATAAEAEAVQIAAQAAETAAAATVRADAAESGLAAGREAHAAHLSTLVAANRAVLAHEFGRMARRETDAARRKRTTPEKLRQWAGDFYAEHELDLWAQALTPAVGVHLALCGKDDDPAAVARQLAAAHMATSQQQILAVAASEPEDYHRALDTTLTRWETARAEAAVDALMRQEIAHVRTV